MTLRTEVEAGASGYSVTGGGDRGIFVKQVLKDSSAAKLFSLREGIMAAPPLGSPRFPSGREGPGVQDAPGGPPDTSELSGAFSLCRWVASFPRRASRGVGRAPRQGRLSHTPVSLEGMVRAGD